MWQLIKWRSLFHTVAPYCMQHLLGLPVCWHLVKPHTQSTSCGLPHSSWQQRHATHATVSAPCRSRASLPSAGKSSKHDICLWHCHRYLVHKLDPVVREGEAAGGYSIVWLQVGRGGPRQGAWEQGFDSCSCERLMVVSSITPDALITSTTWSPLDPASVCSFTQVCRSLPCVANWVNT